MCSFLFLLKIYLPKERLRPCNEESNVDSFEDGIVSSFSALNCLVERNLNIPHIIDLMKELFINIHHFFLYHLNSGKIMRVCFLEKKTC